MTAPAVSAAMRADLGVDVALLDCLQANEALLLHVAGVRDLASVLGAQWWYRDAEPEPELEFEPAHARVVRLTGLRFVHVATGPVDLLHACAPVLASGGLPLVVADAYVLPWVPYAGRRHLDHSFVVTSIDGRRASFTDLYDNQTEWGHATPTDGVLAPDTVDAISRSTGTRVTMLAPGPAPVLQTHDVGQLADANRSALTGWDGADYLATAMRRHGDVDGMAALAELCWTIDRRRRLYARWLAHAVGLHPSRYPPQFVERFAATVVPAWAAVNRFVYLALRRMRGGRAASTGVLETIAEAGTAERALAADWVAHV
jgi:hypothetical protein